MMVKMICSLGSLGLLPSPGRDRVAEGSAPGCPSHLPRGPSCGDPLTASANKGILKLREFCHHVINNEFY